MRAVHWLLLAPGLGLGGCSLGPDPKTKNYVVSAASTEFYKYGPAQTFGPDSALKRGAKVTMVKRDFGFSQVALEDGTTGWLATEDVKAAPPPPAPPKPRGGVRRVASRTSHVTPTPGEPLFDVTDIPLPLPSSTETKPKP